MIEKTTYPQTQVVQRVSTEGRLATYSCQIADLTAIAATATDVFQLTGAANKVIRLRRVQATADATAAGVQDFYLVKRTAANTGGTITHPTITQHDSADPAPSATVNLYSTNPTALGSGSLISADHYALPAAASTGYPGTPWVEDFGNRDDEAIVLRGVNESVAFGFNGDTISSGLNLYCKFEWTEEDA